MIKIFVILSEVLQNSNDPPSLLTTAELVFVFETEIDHPLDLVKSEDREFNPIWTGLFANLKRLLGGGANALPPNLAISSQMTMKLRKDILWIKILTNR